MALATAHSQLAMQALAQRMTPLGAGAEAGWLPDGRLFLCHGPINLVVRADGPSNAVKAAYARLRSRFPEWLGTLVEELPTLRTPATPSTPRGGGSIARRMTGAARAHAPQFITPMAAVAGAVADEAIDVLGSVEELERAFVNNGGDIAVLLRPGTFLDIGVVPSLKHAIPKAAFRLRSSDPIRGIATSGWRGRSHSLGIADAVTVLACDAASADAAATVLANAVNVDEPAIVRAPAATLDERTDLGDRLVTVKVPTLSPTLVADALDAGLAEAERLQTLGLIESAALALQGQWRIADRNLYRERIRA